MDCWHFAVVSVVFWCFSGSGTLAKSDTLSAKDVLHGRTLFINGMPIVQNQIERGNSEKYVPFENSSYRLFGRSNERTWNEARRKCVEDGGHLLIVNSDSEANFIKQLLYTSDLGLAYVGFHDYFNFGEWVTVHGKPLGSTGYVRWTPGEPNNAGGGEHCGTIYVSGGFNDLDCNVATPFICERPNNKCLPV